MRRITDPFHQHAANASIVFWPWFPLGPAGFRTAIIFASGLAILILRIAHYHVGISTESGLQTLKASLLSLKTYETLFWYGVSSSLFCPVFLWSLNDKSGLQWITQFSGDRVRLNERTIFFACYLGACALVQTIVHYQFDLDRLVFVKPPAKVEENKPKGGFISGSARALLQVFPTVFAGCIKQATYSLILCMALYYGLFRSLAWSWSLMVFRPFYNLPRTNIAPATWPTDIFLMVRCIWAGALLNSIWAAGNTAFSVFMAKAPVKNGKPFTAGSKDPNGSLLNGLKSKKSSIQVRNFRIRICFSANGSSALPCGSSPLLHKIMRLSARHCLPISTARTAPCGLKCTPSA